MCALEPFDWILEECPFQYTLYFSGRFYIKLHTVIVLDLHNYDFTLVWTLKQK